MTSGARDLKQVSKLVSYWLRHDPDDAQLVLDESGWADVDALLIALERRGVTFNLDDLAELNVSTDKVRWEIDAEQRRIRACHGHSVSVDLGESAIPPAQLFHGTATRFLSAIKAEGLLPMGRQQVHLTDNQADAEKVGARHGKPVILIIDTTRLLADGWEFHRTAEGIWLTGAIPAEYLVFPE
jgi:putative RNA 2'-phosphotransferase